MDSGPKNCIFGNDRVYKGGVMEFKKIMQTGFEKTASPKLCLLKQNQNQTSNNKKERAHPDA